MLWKQSSNSTVFIHLNAWHACFGALKGSGCASVQSLLWATSLVCCTSYWTSCCFLTFSKPLAHHHADPMTVSKSQKSALLENASYSSSQHHCFSITSCGLGKTRFTMMSALWGDVAVFILSIFYSFSLHFLQLSWGCRQCVCVCWTYQGIKDLLGLGFSSRR